MRKGFLIYYFALAIIVGACGDEKVEVNKGPQVFTIGADKGTYLVASLSGQVSGLEGAALDFECGIEYSTDNSFSSKNSVRIKADKQYTEDSYSITAPEIRSGVDYYYRAYYINEQSVYFGETKTFKFEWEFPYVDLGLSVNWADFNIGSSNPEEFGYYFAWGEVETKSEYTWVNYLFRTYGDKYNNIKFNKYSTSSNYGIVDNKRILDSEDDVANYKWGGNWRIPSSGEFAELKNSDNCSWTWTTQNGVDGFKITSKKPGYTNNSIFLPAAGYLDESGQNKVGSAGNYWHNSLSSSSYYANFLKFSSNGSSYNYGYRYIGQSVRPVCQSDKWLENVTLKLNIEKETILPDNKFNLIATVLKDDNVISFFNDEIKWSSDNPSIATVSESGLVKGVSAGEAVISVSWRSLKATCSVIVVASSIPEESSAVDLGLSVKWAPFNIGAIKPENYGYYYAWGEIRTKESYDWSNYKWSNGTSSTLTKYNNDSSRGKVDNKIKLDTEDDVAHMEWGGGWHMPSKKEFDELIDNCTWTWTTINNVNGYLITSNITGYTDQSIFLPAAEDYEGAVLYNPGCGMYWSGTVSDYSNASALLLYEGNIRIYEKYRYCGLTVRPVIQSDIWMSDVSLKLNKESDKILVGYSAILNATIQKNNSVITSYDSEILYSSDDPSVATVNAKGEIIGVAKGTTVITVSWRNLSSKCTISVIEESDVEHEYVDLGLSVKWATCNVGASKPESYGGYFAWGEVEPRLTAYDWRDYKYCRGSSSYMTKYCNKSGYGAVDNKTKLDLEDDVAHVKWGGNWRMPTISECNDLINNCTWVWTVKDGVSGYIVTSNIAGYTDRSIFMPAAGGMTDDGLSKVGSIGYYWSCSLYTSEPNCAYTYAFNSSERASGADIRVQGKSIRPVCP